MEQKDLITLILSLLAVAISLASLIFTLNQKKEDSNRILKFQLSDTINQLTALGVAFAKLRSETKHDHSPETVDIRRSFNAQRTSLLNYADTLIKDNPSLGNEFIYSIMASNWNQVGSYQKAAENWELAVEASQDPVIKHMTLRGFASFLFFQGNMVAGRAKYTEALELRLPDTENVKRIISDTYLMWAGIEREFGFIDEYPRLLTLAKHSCERISNIQMKSEMQNRIKLFSMT